MRLPLPRLLLATATALPLLAFGCQTRTPIDAVQIPPPVARAADLPSVANVVSYLPAVMSGGVPEGAPGFATLASLGVRTVISVDGMTPDLESAAAHGLRYVHLPIGYDTVTDERQRQLAQAIHNLPQPIYVHCHHGKHRSAAALATALVRSGKMRVDAVIERMHVSGTSPSYDGLWQAVRSAQPMTVDELRRDPASFPEVTKVTGMVATMAEIDQVIDLVRQSHEAGWRAPDDHPDLVAHKETARLAELLAGLAHDGESKDYRDRYGYQPLLRRSIDLARQLDDAVRAGNANEAAAFLGALGKTCKECHRTYRN